jgi:hypothetical protein
MDETYIIKTNRETHSFISKDDEVIAASDKIKVAIGRKPDDIISFFQKQGARIRKLNGAKPEELTKKRRRRKRK